MATVTSVELTHGWPETGFFANTSLTLRDSVKNPVSLVLMRKSRSANSRSTARKKGVMLLAATAGSNVVRRVWLILAIALAGGCSVRRSQIRPISVSPSAID